MKEKWIFCTFKQSKSTFFFGKKKTTKEKAALDSQKFLLNPSLSQEIFFQEKTSFPKVSSSTRSTNSMKNSRRFSPGVTSGHTWSWIQLFPPWSQRNSCCFHPHSWNFSMLTAETLSPSCPEFCSNWWEEFGNPKILGKQQLLSSDLHPAVPVCVGGCAPRFGRSGDVRGLPGAAPARAGLRCLGEGLAVH